MREFANSKLQTINSGFNFHVFLAKKILIRHFLLPIWLAVKHKIFNFAVVLERLFITKIQNHTPTKRIRYLYILIKAL